MARDPARDWMFSEACDMLARAERLHREFFKPVRSVRQQPSWEPPVDILETDREVLVFVALPGVNPNNAEVVIEEGTLVIVGVRTYPAELATATIHRLELPQGRFERRVTLPAGRYASVRRAAADGCLLIALEKAGYFRG